MIMTSHEGTCSRLRMLPTFVLQLLLLQQRTEYENRQNLGCGPAEFHYTWCNLALAHVPPVHFDSLGLTWVSPPNAPSGASDN